MTEAVASPHPTGRDRLAVIAFVLGLLGFLGGLPYLDLYGIGFAFVEPGITTGLVLASCSVAAVVLSPIAFRRCERQRRRGSWLALAGLIGGSLGLPGLVMAISLLRMGDEGGLTADFFSWCW
ncbi:hypothetical protein [Cryptosporangium sp. NPDC048952]|uniref:hypothetical protein n=1 Tax=Cryptosporangium sp. NPDC048952 TaxID=3363961 RepID=UPI0037145C18